MINYAAIFFNLLQLLAQYTTEHRSRKYNYSSCLFSSLMQVLKSGLGEVSFKNHP